MSDRVSGAEPDDRRRIRRWAELEACPPWLRQAVALIGDALDKVEPIKDDRAQLPVFIYRH